MITNLRKDPAVQGFALIEVVVAMAVLGSGLLGMAYLQQLSMGLRSDANQQTRLMLSLNRLLENTRVTSRVLSETDGPGQTPGIVFAPPVAAPHCHREAADLGNAVACFYFELSEFLTHGTATLSRDDWRYSVTVYWLERESRHEALDKTACEALNPPNGNRWWSQGLVWPYKNAPSQPTCMTVQTWVFRV